MRLTRLMLPIVAVAFATALLPGTAASAEPYPPDQEDVVIEDGTIMSGSEAIINGTNFYADERVDFTVTYQTLGMASGPRGAGAAAQSLTLAQAARASIFADSNGNFRAVIQLDRVGRATIFFIGAESGRSGSVTVTVLAEGSDGLAATGTDGNTFRDMLAAGVGAVVIGGLLVAFTVRRRKLSTSSVG